MGVRVYEPMNILQLYGGMDALNMVMYRYLDVRRPVAPRQVLDYCQMMHVRLLRVGVRVSEVHGNK